MSMDTSRHTVIHPVIVSYDGSASARNALAYGLGLARRLGCPLLVVHVVRIHFYGGPLGSGLVELFDAELTERWLCRELHEVANLEGVAVYVRVRRGSAARELAAAVALFSADALVIGAPAPYWRYLAGSVAAWLVKRARCPVIVVP
jgi:nucleotide-binding universal stress UspA family protein